MADSILDGRWKVYYSAENRQKRLWRDTAVTPTVTDTVNDLYSATQDLFDELTQMDDGVPMSAQTPTEYTLGIIDAGDKDPWFIDRTSVEYLTGGAIKTASWARTVGTNTGIVRMAYTETVALVASDIGKDVLMTTDGDRGTLLDFNATGSTKYMWIRPDSSAAANSFDNAPTSNGAWTIVSGTGTGNQAGAATTGESLWANIFSIGTIETDTHIYVKQGSSLLQTYKATSPASDWWADGHIDILVNVKEVDLESDEGVIQVFGRQHSKTYDHFETDLSAGGRNPIPLSTGNDLDNQVGYRQLIMSSDSGNFAVGDRISHVDDTVANAKGVITAISGTTPTRTLQYYLINDPVVDFANTNTVFNVDDTGTGTVNGAPTDVNAAADTDITINLGGDTTFDIDENDTTERYSIVVNCNSKTLEEVQQRLKYMTRRGETTDLDDSSATIAGQFYIGSDRRIIYDTLTGTISQGQVVTQLNSNATGTVVAHHTAAKILILRNSRGTFTNLIADEIRVDASNKVTMSGGGTTSVTVISPIKASPFGTFAGGTFFGAPGVVLSNVASADASNYQLVDDSGNVVNPPTKVSVTVSNTETNDKIAVFRLDGAGGEIDKDRYTVNAAGVAGDTTITVTPAITVDEPGKTTGGVLRLVDVSAQIEYRIRYASWSGSIFTLANIDIAAADAGTDTDTIVEAGAFTASAVKVGDLVLNKTRSNAVSYVTARTDNNTIQISPAITGQTTADAIEVNAVPITLASGTDTVYVPIIDAFETATGQEDTTVTYSANVPVRVRARNAGDIIPFEQDSTITNTGMTVSVIRTPDSIFTP